MNKRKELYLQRINNTLIYIISSQLKLNHPILTTQRRLTEKPSGKRHHSLTLKQASEI